MEKRYVIMDCDPGVDDAIALAYAAAYPELFEILAVSTVSGNQDIEKVTANALKLVSFYQLDIPVAKGAAGPILRTPEYAPYVHGATGLGNCVLPDTDRELASDHAVIFLHDTIMALPEGKQVTLIPTGPLTNIALLFKVFPEVKSRIREILFMGGAALGGNTTRSAEFNIYVDPEAAKVVFDAGIPTVMCGLDVTMKCNLSGERIRAFVQSENPVAKACGEMVSYALVNRASNRKRDAVSIHDAVPFMYLVHPEFFKGQKTILDVDCSDGAARGTTFCDMRLWNYEPEQLTAEVLLDADMERFERELTEAMYRLGERIRV